jgi:hypothetical protein
MKVAGAINRVSLQRPINQQEKRHHMNIVTSDPIDHHATALANVTKMVSDLSEAQAVILQLRADLHREQDRVEMLIEDRDRHRDESNLFRTKLVELATHQANIGLLTVSAQTIVMTVNELLNAPKTDTPALEALEAEFNKGNENEAAGH